jgi:23S rRNA (adenine2030-N6)-methyltransferase
MNYRHGFHAGNFADVFKHALLARILVYLLRKETPFRVIDTHAGEGAYDLADDAATRTLEWRDGVARLADLSDIPASVHDLLQPWLDILGPLDADGRPKLYPGSPLVAARLMRKQDRAIFCELRPDAFATLRWRFGRDARIKTIHLDGYVGLGGFTPPKEKRGLVLIDPPFERTDEFEALFAAFETAYRKWPTGIYALWYPVKDATKARSFCASFAKHDIRRALRLSLRVGGQRMAEGAGERAGLRETGLVIVNPPFVLVEEAAILLPFLALRLAQGAGSGYDIDWLTEE